MLGFICAGNINSSASILKCWGKPFTVVRESTGKFIITHNLDTTDYGVIVSGMYLSSPRIFGASIYGNKKNQFTIDVFACDGSRVDEGFYFQMFKLKK